MNDQNIDRYFVKVRNNVSNIYNAFYLWKNLQNSKYNEIYNRNRYFWGITISSLNNYCLLGLSKLFEIPKEGKEVVSIPFLLNFMPESRKKKQVRDLIEKHKPTLDKLWKWRIKILAHEDKVVAENLRGFYKKHLIKGGDIENLLEATREILGIIKSSITNHSEIYSFSIFIEESKRDTEDIMDKLKNDEMRVLFPPLQKVD